MALGIWACSDYAGRAEVKPSMNQMNSYKLSQNNMFSAVDTLLSVNPQFVAYYEYMKKISGIGFNNLNHIDTLILLKSAMLNNFSGYTGWEYSDIQASILRAIEIRSNIDIDYLSNPNDDLEQQGRRRDRKGFDKCMAPARAAFDEAETLEQIEAMLIALDLIHNQCCKSYPIAPRCSN